MRQFLLNFQVYVKNINDLSCNYFGVKQYCMLRKAKKSFTDTSFVQLIYYGL